MDINNNNITIFRKNDIIDKKKQEQDKNINEKINEKKKEEKDKKNWKDKWRKFIKWKNRKNKCRKKRIRRS